MAGISDLASLLASMQPELHGAAYGFGLIASGRTLPDAFAQIVEDAGTTVIAPVVALQAAGIAVDAQWARISLHVHSDLAAVGLTAAIATALSARGISANVVAGYFHDHFFVQWDRRDAAMAVLADLSGA